MKIEITHGRKISEVQKDFNNLFTYLRIEFLQHGLLASRQYKSGAGKFITSTFALGELNRHIKPSILEFTSSTTVYELEDTFFTKTGLYICVLRKSSNIWMETTMTGNWSLLRQNEHGREISATA